MAQETAVSAAIFSFCFKKIPGFDFADLFHRKIYNFCYFFIRKFFHGKHLLDDFCLLFGYPFLDSVFSCILPLHTHMLLHVILTLFASARFFFKNSSRIPSWIHSVIARSTAASRSIVLVYSRTRLVYSVYSLKVLHASRIFSLCSGLMFSITNNRDLKQRLAVTSGSFMNTPPFYDIRRSVTASV